MEKVSSLLSLVGKESELVSLYLDSFPSNLSSVTQVVKTPLSDIQDGGGGLTVC